MADERYTVEFRSDGAARVAKNVRKIGTNAKTTTKSLLTMKNALVALATGLVVREVVQASDAWTKMSNSIKVTTKSLNQLNAIQTESLDIARNTRSDAQGTATLYQRLSMANKNLGKSQKEILEFTELVNMSLATSGATAQETRSTLIQLGQGLGSVAVRGDEFRSVMENSPRLVKALGDATGLTTGQIKELTAQGKFLSKDFFEAIMSQGGALRDDFKKTQATFGQVRLVFNNVFTEIVGRLGVQTGIFGDIAEGLLNVADKIRDAVREGMAGVMTLRDALKDLSAREGAGKAFIKTAQLAGDIFMQTLFAGFKLLAVVMVDLGKILGDAIAEGVKGNAKDIGATLMRYSGVAGYFASGGTKKRQKETPSIDIGELKKNFKATQAELSSGVYDTVQEFYADATNDSKDWTSEMHKNREALMGTASAIEDVLAPQIEEVATWGQSFFSAFSEMNTAAMSFSEIMATTVTESIRGASDELAKFIVTGTADFKSLAQSIIQDLISIMIQKQLTNAVGGIGGVLGFTGTSTPQNQFGGPVQANTPTMVGERGPELFVPQSAGKIMTNAQSSGGGDSKQPRIVNIFDSDAAFKSVTPSTQAEITMNFVKENSLALSGTLA